MAQDFSILGLREFSCKRLAGSYLGPMSSLLGTGRTGSDLPLPLRTSVSRRLSSVLLKGPAKMPLSDQQDPVFLWKLVLFAPRDNQPSVRRVRPLSHLESLEAFLPLDYEVVVRSNLALSLGKCPLSVNTSQLGNA